MFIYFSLLEIIYIPNANKRREISFAFEITKGSM